MDRDAEPAAAPKPAPVVRLDVTVRGYVQGVGFRYHVLRRAMDLGLVGWVANTADGSVRCVVEGPRPVVETLLGIVEIGPAGALVERVLSTWSEPTGGFSSFEIRSGGHPGD
ncbi:MAG: acylphosphatase [Candidatus Limnocylindrales bacterium]